ncbi:MAG: hypothetical protein EBX55_11855, partial [Betaproteobacteria bacterium]|nr:hypothetical protein [Betaproteobacteria bacterium]
MIDFDRRPLTLVASHLGLSIEDYFAILDSAMSITVVDDELPDVVDESADQMKALQHTVRRACDELCARRCA